MIRGIIRKTAMATLIAAMPAGAAAETFVVDLTHPIPTFEAMKGDPMKADVSKPHGDSKPIPTFGGQVALTFSKFPINLGYFALGTLVLAEHHGTHLDTAYHFVNKPESMEPSGTPPDKRKKTHQLGGDDLVGRVVLIDISGRVQATLDKNGGKPSPDPKVTDFSNTSNATVTADDIAAVEDQLDNGVWLVLNLGWSRFYFSGPDFGKGPYVNGFNHPGMTTPAVDKLIEIMDRKKIKILGIAADNISIDAGEVMMGDKDGKFTNGFYAHVRLLQRNLLFVENAANLGQLAQAKQGSCTLVVGAPKHVGGTGGPSRVIAICEK